MFLHSSARNRQYSKCKHQFACIYLLQTNIQASQIFFPFSSKPLSNDPKYLHPHKKKSMVRETWPSHAEPRRPDRSPACVSRWATTAAHGLEVGNQAHYALRWIADPSELPSLPLLSGASSSDWATPPPLSAGRTEGLLVAVLGLQLPGTVGRLGYFFSWRRFVEVAKFFGYGESDYWGLITSSTITSQTYLSPRLGSALSLPVNL